MAHSCKLLLCLITALLFTVSSCKKTKEAPEPENTTTVTLDKTTAVPGDVVLLTVSNTLENKPSWEATLGGRRVVVGRVSDKQAAFLVPELPSGATTLDLAQMGFKDAKPFTIGQYTAIQDPAPVFADFQSRLAVAVTYTEQLTRTPTFPVSTQNLAVLRNLQQKLPAIYAASTPAQKLEAAYIMRQQTFAQFDFTTLGDRTTANDDPADRISKMVTPYAVARQKVAFCVGVMVGGSFFANPLVTAAGAVGMLYYLNEAVKIQEDILNTAAVALRIDDYSNRPTGTDAGTLTLVKNVTKTTQIEATYRTMQAADTQGPALLRQLMAGVEELRKLHARLQEGLDQLNQWLLGGAATISPFVGAKAQAATQAMHIPARLLRVRNISNPEISITVTAPTTGDVLTLKANSNTITAITPFTFEVYYENAALGVNVSKTVTAEYQPVAVCLTPTQLQLLTNGGRKTWRLTQIVDHFRSNGAVNYTAVPRAGDVILFTFDKYAGNVTYPDYGIDATGAVPQIGRWTNPSRTFTDQYCWLTPDNQNYFVLSYGEVVNILELNSNTLRVRSFQSLYDRIYTFVPY